MVAVGFPFSSRSVNCKDGLKSVSVNAVGPKLVSTNYGSSLFKVHAFSTFSLCAESCQSFLNLGRNRHGLGTNRDGAQNRNRTKCGVKLTLQLVTRSYFSIPPLSIPRNVSPGLHSDLSVAPRVESGSQGSLRLLVSVLTHGCDYSLCTQTGFNISDCRASDFVTFSTVRQIQKYCLCLTLQSWKANC